MRALCASIISAGALVGLGLAALGVGTRYQGVAVTATGDSFVHWKQLDTPMMLILVLLILTLARRPWPRHSWAWPTTTNAATSSATAT